jgi:hypothetical protein
MDNNMSETAVFVDLPNLYSQLLRLRLADNKLVRDYFLYWFDLDRLSERLTGEYSTVWVFYSDKRIGPSGERIQDQYLTSLIDRLNRQCGVTAYNVNIPGDQREPASYECEECGHRGIAEWESEKGIDSALTVHMIDTMKSWDRAFLLSGDADFVPVVALLRRRGKIITGAGFSNASSALIRECYDYRDLIDTFQDDIAAYAIFRENGPAFRWFNERVEALSDSESDDVKKELSIRFYFAISDVMGGLIKPTLKESGGEPPLHYVFFEGEHISEMEKRYILIDDYKQEFPQYTYKDDTNKLIISHYAWGGVYRRLEDTASSLNGNIHKSYDGQYSISLPLK